METKEYKGMEYIKDFHSLTDNVVSVLADGKFPTSDKERWDNYLKDTCGGDRVLGVIEFPYIDIELEAYARITDRNGYCGYLDEPNVARKNEEICLTYAICWCGLFRGERSWELYDDDGKCKVDFSSDNWEEMLEKDMCERLEKFAEKHGLSFTEPNFITD